MKANETKSAQAQNESVKNAQVNNTNEEAKPKSLKSLANDESKREMFGKEAAIRACKTAFDIDGGATRNFIHSLGFSAQLFKGLKSEDLDVHSKSGIRFCTWEVLGACVRYAKEHDLTGERAKKEAKEAERKAAAEARQRMQEKKQVTSREDVRGEYWVKCINKFGEVVGYQRTDINRAPIGKIWTAEEYKAKKTADKAEAKKNGKK